MSCGQPNCWVEIPHRHSVSVIRRGAETLEQNLIIPLGQRGLRCVICDQPSERAVCCR